jgi:hypothetical protein
MAFEIFVEQKYLQYLGSELSRVVVTFSLI